MYYGVLNTDTSIRILNSYPILSTFPWLSTLMLLTLTKWGVVHADSEIMYEFQDNITAGEFIGNIKRDSKLHRRYDDADLQQFSFTFLERTVHYEDQKYFRLREDSGGLLASQTIDRDDLCRDKPTCILHLDIAVQPAKFFQVVRVIVILYDANDNAPVFPQTGNNFTVSEDAPVGIRLSLVPAVDPDSGTFSVQHYELLGDTDLFQLDVNEFGEIWIELLKRLNREEKAAHNLTLIAYDGGTPPKSGNTTITISVDDVNDNAPKFTNPAISCNIAEDTLRGEVVMYVHAIDLDKGKNGQLTYEFSNLTKQQYGSIFRLNSKSGKLTLTRSLDREKQSRYALEVIAKDNGPFSIPAKAKIIVNVLDVNDNIPEISISPLHENRKLVVMEGLADGSFVAHISVQDKDYGENGRTNCSLLNTNGYFRLSRIGNVHNGEFKMLANAPLDREVKAKHRIVLVCHDFGSPQLSRELPIPVIIADVNDHVPKFEHEMYSCSIIENTEAIDHLLAVRATEPDSGLNGYISYVLGREAGNVFKINETSGVITTVTPFNREEIGDVVEFRVMAVDQGFIPLTATTTVQVTILDQDDEAPKFTQAKYIFNIYENLPENTAIGTVSAFDRDLPPHTAFSFYLDASKTLNASWFYINPETGEISSKVPYDREQRAIHDVYVRVQGDANPRFFDEALVQVYITDINDNPPNITYPNINENKVYVSSDTKKGEIVQSDGDTSRSQIKAHDPDQGVNGMLTYHFTNDSGTDFRIDVDTGFIYVNTDIRDFVHEFFPVKVIVRDKGTPQKSSRSVFYIIVTNKFSDLNTWDRYRLGKDRGMSMELRVSIIVIVVVMSMVSIIVFSIVIRLYTQHRKSTTGESQDDDTPYSHTNGFIPNSCQSFASSPANSAATPNGDVFFVNSKKRSKSIVSTSTSPSTTSAKTPAEEVPMLLKEREATSDGRAADDEDSEVTDLKRHLADEVDKSSDQTSSLQRKSVHFEQQTSEEVEEDIFQHKSGMAIGPIQEQEEEQLWDALDIANSKLKHSIPGVCTIIAASSDDSPTQAEPLLRKARRKMPRVPNESIVRYSKSLANQRGVMMHPSPPPIPKHVPPPIHISSPMTAQVRTFHYPSPRNTLPVYIKREAGSNKLTVRPRIPNHVPKQGVSNVPRQQPFYGVSPHTFSGQAHMIKFDKMKRRPVSQALFTDSPEDSDGSYI